MRLLTTDSQIPTVELFVKDPPPYAILSHRWQDDEVTFQDISRPDISQKMKGYEKLVTSCQMARKLGFKYLWMDTCCIDKTNSDELTEAINSMYRWYKQSGVCLAFLFDVEKTDPESAAESKWFTRGWTLQELIAPTEVIFYNQKWQLCGTKTSMAFQIRERTGIDEVVLLTGNMDSIPVSRKMFWASSRETQRPEDEAYSLLGIFGINMPAIYGEGHRAFIRLQEEILKTTLDHSIFAWGSRQVW